MSDHSVQAIVDHLISLAGTHGYEIDRLVVYGSYADGTATAESDVDIVVVSPDFDGTDFYARTEDFYWHWDVALPKPDLITLTPAEFESRSADSTDIVHEALETGVDVTPVTPDTPE